MAKVIMITGGTSGLGRGAARKLLAQGHAVVITGRSQDKLDAASAWILDGLPLGDAAKTRLHKIVLDQSSLASVDAAAAAWSSLGLPRLDVLIHNAAEVNAELEYVSETTVVDKTIFGNAVAPWYLTLRMAPFLVQEERARVIFVTSSLHDPKVRRGGLPDSIDLAYLDGRKHWDGIDFYCLSKVAQLWLMYRLVERFPRMDIFAFCPGFVPTTDLNRHYANWLRRFLMRYVISRMSIATSEDASTDQYVYLATSEELRLEGTSLSGAYFRDGQRAESSLDSRDVNKSKQFWNLACDICKLPDQKYEDDEIVNS